MTKREVEIERTVTESEEVTICDYCGLDENEGEGDMRTFRETPLASEGSKTLHLHDECAEAGLGDLGPMPALEDSELFTPLLAFDELVIGFVGVGAVIVFGGYSLWTIANTTAESIVAVGAMGAGVLLLLCAIFAARVLATTALDTANDWWEDQL